MNGLLFVTLADETPYLSRHLLTYLGPFLCQGIEFDIDPLILLNHMHHFEKVFHGGVACGEGSIRCRLLLGLFNAWAKPSKPMVEFTRSLSKAFPSAVSPTKKAESASSNRAAAKAGPRSTRALTVSLNNLVNGI